MDTSKTLIIVVAVDRYVENVFFTEFLHHLFDVGHALSTFTHRLSGVVGVTAGAVPVREKLRGKRNIHNEVFSDTREEVAWHVEVVTNFNTSAGSNLVLPLTGHNFRIGTRNFDTSVKAGLVVSISNKATEAHVGASRAVVRPLLSGVSIVWPSQGMGSKLGWVTDEGVFLFDTVPGFLVLDKIMVPDFVGEVSEVGVGGNKLLATIILPAPALAEDKNVFPEAERITEVSDGLEDDLRLISDSLVGRGAIVIPFGYVSKGFHFIGEGAALGAEGDTWAINPDVFSNYWASLIKVVEAMSVLVVECRVCSVTWH
jgi:hypothetical protein